MRAGSQSDDVKDKTTTKIRRKPGRVPTSCAECRRLKLRCDKNVPCEKCVSRGCGSICPDGCLAPGKGNRLILANTEELHDRIEQLRIRVRELENALRALQKSVSDEPHPLLQSSTLLPPQQSPLIPKPIPPLTPASDTRSSASPISEPVRVSERRPGSVTSSPEEDDPIDAYGTLAVGARGQSSFYGRTARSEYLIRALSQLPFKADLPLPRLSKRIVEPVFPDPMVMDKSLGREVFSMLPTISEAAALCEIYQEYGQYMFTPIPRRELFDEILGLVYRADSFENIQCYHSLSLLFIVFGIACLFDPARPPYSVEAQEYYYLARTALGFNPQTTRLSIQAYIHVSYFLEFVDADMKSSNSIWMYIGHAVRLGLSLGLHLDASRWQLSERNVQRRSRLFWQLFILDTWASLYFGRPPTICTPYIDCPLPRDESSLVDEISGEKQMSFHSWNWKYTALLHSILTTAFGSKPPPYSVIISLDRKVRDFPVPPHWRPVNENQRSPAPPASLEVHMQRWMILSNKETTLLNLHKAYFAQALRDKPCDLARHRYVPSVLAIYRSAWRLIEGLRLAWKNAPHPLTRTSLPWSQALSAAIVMCLLVTRAPSSTMTQSALSELDTLVKLFEDAAQTCQPAANLMDAIKSLHSKAHEMLSNSCVPGAAISHPELDRLGGKTHLVTEMGAPDTGECSPSPSVTVTGSPIDHVYFSDLRTQPTSEDVIHPTIAQDMRTFDMGGLGSNDFFDVPAQQPGPHTLVSASPPHPHQQHQHHQHHASNVTSDLRAQESDYYSLPSQSHHMYHLSSHSSSMPHSHTPTLASLSTSTIFDQPVPMLDPTWQSFAEQLGFS